MPQTNSPVYQHECFLYCPIQEDNTYQSYIGYIGHKCPPPGYINGGMFSQLGRDAKVTKPDKPLVQKCMSLGDFINIMYFVEKEFHTSTSSPQLITSTERVKAKLAALDPSPGDVEDLNRVLSEVYLVVVENAFPDALMVQPEPGSVFDEDVIYRRSPIVFEVTRLAKSLSALASSVADLAKFTQDLRKSESDIVIEEDLENISGRVTMVAKLGNEFKVIITKDIKIIPLRPESELVLRPGPAPTVTRALSFDGRRYLATVIQLPFLG